MGQKKSHDLDHPIKAYHNQITLNFVYDIGSRVAPFLIKIIQTLNKKNGDGFNRHFCHLTPDEISLEKVPNGIAKPGTPKPRTRCPDIPKPNLNKLVRQHVPILDWLPRYNLDEAISDLIAGITVGLTIIPQGIAYALVANLPAQVCLQGYLQYIHI